MGKLTFSEQKMRAMAMQHEWFERQKPRPRVRQTPAPTERLHYIFACSSLLRDLFQDIRDYHPDILERDAMVQFVSLAFVLLKQRGKANYASPDKLRYGRMHEALRRIRQPRQFTVDMLVHSQESVERLEREENLHARFTLAWEEATGQPLHRDRFQLQLGKRRNQLLAQALCRALVVLGY